MDIQIRPLTQADLSPIQNWLQEEENVQWLATFFREGHLPDTRLAFFFMGRDKSTFIITLENEPVGVIGLVDIDTLNRSAHLWCLVGNKDYRRKGVASRAHNLLLNSAFNTMGLETVNLWVAQGNVSEGLYNKLGFTHAGTLRRCHLLKGELVDRLLFDMTRKEYESRAFQTISS